MSDVSLDDFGASRHDLPENFAIALKWTALEPNYILRAIWKIDRAQNWDEFRDAVRDFAAPSQNLIYADVDGNIGYQTPGRIPARNPGHDGMMPVPGWTDEYEWLEYIPYEWLPFAFNPAEGYIVTANNAVVGPEYPFTLSREWDYGYRAQTILDAILNAPARSISPNPGHAGQRPHLNAEQLLPILLELLWKGNLQAARAPLAGGTSSPTWIRTAALFQVFWKNLFSFGSHLPEDFQPGGGSGWVRTAGLLIALPGHAWWDDAATPETEDRDAAFAAAFAAAVAELEERQGRDPEDWNWGDLHTLYLPHDVMGNFPGIGLLFDAGPFRTSGGSSIVNATGWSADSDGYAVESLPSMRMIVDLSALENSLTMHTTGQSGHAGHPQYSDMADPWRLIRYHGMGWDPAQVQADAESHMLFVP
jgi:penicillin amidase